MLGEVVGEVLDALVPVDVEVTLSGAILDPIVPHVHGFGATLTNRVVGNTSRSGIVGDNGCGALGVAKFRQCVANGFGITTVVEEASELGFSSGGDDFLEAMGDDKDGTVEANLFELDRFAGVVGGRLIAEVEEAGVAGAREGFAEVGSITVDMKPHGAGEVGYGGIGVARSVVEKLDNELHGAFGGSTLLCGKRVDGDEHGVVDGTGVE